MWMGLLIGLLISFVIVCLVSIENDNLILNIFIFILSITIGIIVGYYVDKLNYEQYINSYTIKKETIESSLNSNILSDLEKIELLKQVVELNGELAENKVKVNKFIYFYLDKSKINELEKINLEDRE